MSPAVKAAASFSLVFVLLVVGFFVFIRGGNAPVSDDLPPEDEPTTKPEVAVIDLPEPGEAITTPPPSRDAVKLTVEVLEERSERPLPQAYVRVMKSTAGDRPGDNVYDSRSEPAADGPFTIHLVPGAYILHAQCPRYTGERLDLTVVKDTPQDLRLLLDRGNSISGRVTDQSGSGVAGARVVALKELGSPDADLEELLIGLVTLPEMTNTVNAETTSAEDGSYQLDGLKPEWYTVRAVARGFTPNQVEKVPAPRERVDIALAAGSSLGGLVRDPGGNPIAGVAVSAYKHIESQSIFDVIMAKSRPPVDKVYTDSAGHFTFETLGTGVFNFAAESPNDANLGFQRYTVTKFTVTPNMGDALNITMQPGAKIIGYIEDPNGNPVVGASVRAQKMGGGARMPREQVAISFDDGSVLTNDIGRFEFNTLEQGQYSLLCFHEDYQSVRRQGVQADSNEVRIQMNYGGRVTGHVTDKDGNPIAGARVMASDMADKQKEAVSQEDGLYLLSGLQAGARKVSVTVTAKGFARNRSDVQVTLNREVELNFEMEPTGIVSGVVVNSDNDPIANARVMVKKRQSENSGVAQTVGTGFTDRQGRYRIADVEAGAGLTIQAKKAEYLESEPADVVLVSGGSSDLDPIVMTLGGAITGRVVDAAGTPVKGCMVSVRFEGDTDLEMQGNPSGTTGVQGTFQIKGLEAATVDLVVKAPRHLPFEQKGVEVREGERHVVADIVLQQGNSVSGVVLDGSNNPIVGASVVATDFTEGLTELTSTTDAQGRFTVDRILSDDQVGLEVSHPEYSKYSVDAVKIGTNDLSVVLGDLARISGKVLGDDGEPIVAFTVQPQYQSERRDPRKDIKPKTFSGESGTFEFKGVSAGTYNVQISAPSYSAVTLENVSVGEGESVDLGDIGLKVGGIVYGQVIDQASGSPVNRARVQIVQGRSRFAKAPRNDTPVSSAERNPTQFTDADGRFRFSGLKDGNLSLRVSLSGYVTQKIDSVNPALASSSQDLVISLSPGGDIAGQVLDAAGKPKARMPVYLMGDDSSSNQQTSTDREGRFRFAGVPGGTFTVKAHQFRPAAGGNNEHAESQVNLEPGQSVEVTLQVQ